MNKSFSAFLVMVFFVIITITLVSETTGQSDEKVKSIDQIANEITRELAKGVKEKHNLELTGMGGGGVDGLNLLTVVFDGINEYRLEYARNILVDVSLDFLSLINSSEELKGRLKQFPFSLNNVKVMIGFSSKDHLPPSKPNISFMVLGDGRILYCVGGERYKPYEHAGEETFEEALSIVAKSQDLSVSARAKEYLLAHTNAQ